MARPSEALEQRVMSSFDTLRWRGHLLEMLDQRALPNEMRYLQFRSAAEVATGIRDMVVRGAPAIGVAAAYGIAVEAMRVADQPAALFSAALDQADAVLRASRPTAVNLSWALDAMLVLRVTLPAEPRRAAPMILEAAHRVARDDVEINRTMGMHGSKLLADGARVLTHCNAGALAAAGHGTALGVIRSAVEAGKRIAVIADETRPFLQGARLTAWELHRDHIPVTLITDGMSGHLMQLGEIDAVIVGCDRVAANGDVANKIGTYMIAVLARRHEIPFYVACPLSTIDLGLADGSLIPIEERDAAEVTGYGALRWAPEGIGVRNPAFDVTPAALVSALITEKGVLRNPDQAGIARLFAAT